MSTVDTALGDIAAAIAALAPAHEGLRDFARLNVRPETLVEVRTAIEQYDRRLRLLTVAQSALDALVADGYPDLATRDIAAAVLADLQANAASIETALALFGAVTATTLRLSATPPTPK
jgi:hypothetical protein